MELKRWKSAHGANFETTRDELTIVCTEEEYKILRELLEHAGVNLGTSVSDGRTRECYVLNEYKQVVQGWGTDLMKELGDEFFECSKRY